MHLQSVFFLVLSSFGVLNFEYTCLKVKLICKAYRLLVRVKLFQQIHERRLDVLHVKSTQTSAQCVMGALLLEKRMVCPTWYHKRCVRATIESEWRCSCTTSSYAHV